MGEEWSYVRGGQKLGPVSLETLKQMVSDGTLGREDLVWRPGMENWVSAASVPEIWPTPEGDIPQALPAQVVGYAGPAMEGIVCTPRALDLLIKTRPWIRLISIFMWVVTGLTAIAGVVTAVMDRNVMTALPLLIIIVLYVIPAVYLTRFGSRVGQLKSDRRPETLEAALDSQRAFWRVVGIMLLVVVALYVVGIAVAAVAAIMF